MQFQLNILPLNCCIQFVCITYKKLHGKSMILMEKITIQLQ